MKYWLMKSEPDVFSYDDLVKKGKEHWDGVRNYTARNNMRAMKKGDKALFYHSNIDKAAVGIMQIVKEAYQDPTTMEEQWVCVDVSPVEKLKHPVSLASIKANPKLAEMKIIKQSRLSVTDVTKQEFDEILRMSKKA
ncbi:MAG: EVE domain-containing protein [Sphingobacteriales bacterium]|jgi:predicted RNA-binding protein with PUA-like domain|nr:EVE domain-containing protein [Sphingobacteriales bacterium]